VKQLISLILTTVLWSGTASAALRLEVDLSDRELVASVDGGESERFAVAVGKDSYPTPAGTFSIRKVILNPSWVPPDSKWARGKTAKPPGHPENPMKLVKMFFKEPDYYIHGTADEDSLGGAESHGCIRMSEEDVTRLTRLVMEHGGKPMPEPWYRRIFRRKSTKVVYLETPVPIAISK
jgi:lipoprotein-anchoring transpeptidase ErfK/SrfK